MDTPRTLEEDELWTLVGTKTIFDGPRQSDFFVSSKSVTDAYWLCNTDRPSCSCPAGQFRFSNIKAPDKVCDHVRAARAFSTLRALYQKREQDARKAPPHPIFDYAL